MRSWWPNREGGGWAATLCPTPVRQPVVGGFQFRHPLAKRVPLVGDYPRGIDQRLVIAAKSPELFQDAVQGCTQRRQLAAERFVALFTLSQLLPEQRVIHDGSIISASRKTSSAKRLRHRRDFCVGAGACASSHPKNNKPPIRRPPGNAYDAWRCPDRRRRSSSPASRRRLQSSAQRGPRDWAVGNARVLRPNY